MLILPYKWLRNLTRWRLLLCLLNSVIWDTCHHPSSGSEVSIKVSTCCGAVVTSGPGLQIKVRLHQLLAHSGGELEVCRVNDAPRCCALCRWSPPWRETKTQTIWSPEATFTYCYGSHIEREAILGSLPQAGSSWWNQPFSARYCLTTTKRPTWMFLPEFSDCVFSSNLFSFRDSNQS